MKWPKRFDADFEAELHVSNASSNRHEIHRVKGIICD